MRPELTGNLQVAMTRQLDPTDRAILAQLRINARMPLVALARAIGRSRSATQERLQRLEREGTIAGYTLRANPTAESGLSAWIYVTAASGSSCTKIAPQLQAMPEATIVHSLSGRPDLAALVRVGSQEELIKVRQSISDLPGVGEVQTQLVLADYSVEI